MKHNNAKLSISVDQVLCSENNLIVIGRVGTAKIEVWCETSRYIVAIDCERFIEEIKRIIANEEGQKEVSLELDIAGDMWVFGYYFRGGYFEVTPAILEQGGGEVFDVTKESGIGNTIRELSQKLLGVTIDTQKVTNYIEEINNVLVEVIKEIIKERRKQ